MDYSFGNWIKRRRKALDLSQQDLADQVGCSVSAIFKIESDERRPSRQIAELLAEHLQIPHEQRTQFIRVARREKMIESLEPLPVPLELLVQPWHTLPKFIHPGPDSPLVGRGPELNLIVQQLREPHCRLLTLTGLGGVGKTRLALEATEPLRERFADGVFLTALAGISESRFILPAIADAVGFIFSGTGDPDDELLNYLREKEILLILDNFEHLLQGVELLVRILREAPRVKLLVTSRESLNLQAEWVFEVQGLPVPAEEADNSLQAGSAALLFIQRAGQVRLGFLPTSKDYLAITRICQMVEGLPLGIELAAAWVRVLSCEQISMEIEHNLDFLRTTRRDIPERHRSLRAALDHSWGLLSEREQEAFRQLSVFRGGFRIEAAQEVAGARLEEIASLLNKSMVKRLDEERYDMHELVRQYAAAQLASVPLEIEQTHERYSRYYARLLERWQRPLRSPRQMEILEEMAAEMDNIRPAWSWMIAHRQYANIRKSLLCLWYFYEIRGRFQEGEIFFEQAVEALQPTNGPNAQPEEESLVVLGLLQLNYAYFSSSLGCYEQASTLMQQSLDMLRTTTDQAALASALTLFAYLLYRKGELQQASQAAQESLELNRARDYPIGIAYSLIILSYIHLDKEEYEQAFTMSTESLAICRDRLGDPHGTADSLIPLCRAARRTGRTIQAKRWAQEGLEISRATNDRWGAGQTLRQLGLINFELGETKEAIELLSQSVAKFREAGDRPLMAQTMIDLSVLERAADAPARSKQQLMEAFRVAVETDSLDVAARALMEIAWNEMEEGRKERALELVTFVLENAENNQKAKDSAAHLMTKLAALLTPELIEAVQAQVQGRALADLAQELSV